MKTYLLIAFFIAAMVVGFATASSLVVFPAAFGAIATACLSHPEAEPRKEPMQQAVEKSLTKARNTALPQALRTSPLRRKP